ncbi:Gfo/Idh/MocA family protein [Nonomuraea sp. NPDC004702]
MAERRRYALSGLSRRAMSVFVRPLRGPYAEAGELVAVCDPDEARVRELDPALPWYPPERLDDLITETRPDTLLVAGPDFTHAEAVLTGLGRGLAVVSEKPMVTTARDAARIVAADPGGRVRVTHNLRYAPRHQAVKRLIMEGEIGRVVGVELVWNVETLHGASYFQRWNRRAEFSGGLQVHKSCHHFDLVGWWLADVPVQVFGYGSRAYYGAGSPHAADDPYRRRWAEEGVSLPDSPLGHIYDTEIDIEDNYAALVRYRGGAHLSYSIQFSAPWEGYRLGINGTHGRIEATLEYGRRAAGPPEPIVLYPMFGDRREIVVEGEAGRHLGADELLVRDLFAGDGDDPLGLRAGSRDGARAVAVGEAVRRSSQTGQPVDIEALLASGRP